ncbi:MAG: YgaP family membrane protein [Chitinophagaceae bacterium]
MKSNMGKTDRLFRIVLAIVFGMLSWFKVGGEIGQWVFVLLGIVMAATALIRFCPLYTLIGFKTNQGEETSA